METITELKARLEIVEPLYTSYKKETEELKAEIAKKEALIDFIRATERIAKKDCPVSMTCEGCVCHNEEDGECLRSEVERRLKTVYKLLPELKEEQANE